MDIKQLNQMCKMMRRKGIVQVKINGQLYNIDAELCGFKVDSNGLQTLILTVSEE